MRLSSALFTSALACLVSSAIAREIPIAGRYALEARQNRNGNNGGNRNGGGRNGGGGGGGGGRASSTSSAAPAATSGTGRGGNNGGNNGGGNGGGNPATSLTLDPSVINSNFARTGQEGGGDPGQVASLTSTNNFINFCVGKTLTNGQQVRGGSCNATPMGDLPSTSRMPSGKFVSPKNLDTLQPNTAFTVQLAVKNMATGNFVNPQTNYFAAPQQLNGQGTIIAHSHVVIEQIDSLTSTTATDPTKFAFFQGLNAPAQGGVLSATVTNGLPAGVYRISSINTSANHAPVVGPVAQHGSFDDAIYITVGGGRGGNGGGNGGGKKNKLARRFPSREGKARL